MTTTPTTTGLTIRIDHDHAHSLPPGAVAALHHLARAVQQPCDAIHAETGARCTLRAGHPGDIHEECMGYGRRRQYRVDGPMLRIITA